METKKNKLKTVLLLALGCAAAVFVVFNIVAIPAANTLVSAIEDEDLKEQVSIWDVWGDYYGLNKMFDVSQMEVAEVDQEGKVVYVVEYGEDYAEYVTTWHQGTDAYIRIEVPSRDLVNVIRCTLTGGMYLEEVIVDGVPQEIEGDGKMG